MYVFLIMFLSFTLSSLATLPPGLAYRRESLPHTTIHILEIDPQHFDLVLATAPTLTTVSELARQKKAIAGVNGGFFNKRGSPSAPLKEGPLWSGQSSKKRGAVGLLPSRRLVFGRLSRPHNPPEGQEKKVSSPWERTLWVLGAGPLLIQDGKPLSWESEKLAPPFLKTHARTALCETADGWLLVVADAPLPSSEDLKEVVQGPPSTLLERLQKARGGLTMKEWQAYLLKLGCRNALNLDGGSSSSFYVEGALQNAPWAQLSNPHPEPRIANAILVRPRSALK